MGVTEGYENTSFINEVMAQVNEQAFDYLDAPMVRVAAANVPVPRAEVLEDHGHPERGPHHGGLPKGGELMAEELFIPKLGQTVEEVTLVKWLVPDGAKVGAGPGNPGSRDRQGRLPVEASAKGYLHLGPFAEGQVVPVLTVVAIIGRPDDKFRVPRRRPRAKPKPQRAACGARRRCLADGGRDD